MKIPKNYLIVGGVLVVLIAGGGAMAAVTMNKNKSSENTKSQTVTPTQAKPVPKPKYADATLYKVGDTVQYQSVSLKVNSVKSSSSISGAFSSPVFADPGTKFMIVNLTVTNTTTDPFTYNPFILIDQKDRLFNAYDKTIGNVDGYLETAELSPSVPKSGNEVYQVPQDSTTLKLGGNVGNTDKLLLVQFQAE